MEEIIYVGFDDGKRSDERTIIPFSSVEDFDGEFFTMRKNGKPTIFIGETFRRDGFTVSAYQDDNVVALYTVPVLSKAFELIENVIWKE